MGSLHCIVQELPIAISCPHLPMSGIRAKQHTQENFHLNSDGFRVSKIDVNKWILDYLVDLLASFAENFLQVNTLLAQFLLSINCTCPRLSRQRESPDL